MHGIRGRNARRCGKRFRLAESESCDSRERIESRAFARAVIRSLLIIEERPRPSRMINSRGVTRIAGELTADEEYE